MDAPRRALAWFRRDLRLTDQRMLEAATRAERVWPVFVADPEILRRHAGAPARVAWFEATIDALDARLRERGSGLTILHGDPGVVLREFAGRVGAEAVFATRDEEPAARRRDAAVARLVDLRLVDDQRLVPADALRTAAGAPFSVYTPFRRRLDDEVAASGEELVATATPDLDRLAPSTGAPQAQGLGRLPSPHELPAAGERAAADRVRAFLRSSVAGYADDRDRPDRDGTSRISPYLRVGALSVRSAWRASLNAEARGRERRETALRRGARRWRDELAWREFYASVLLAHPEVESRSRHAEYDAIAWEEGAEADEALAAWSAGRTGYPIVDAGMRQLLATGWMHNRLRLVTASFLVKDLGLDWRRGEAVFMDHLLDGDLAQNNGNWQWVAGVGTDAAPYFRVFNPIVQGRRFDPGGAFVRAWVPELADLAAEWIHEPWRAPSRPRGYPLPIVDHAHARQRTLARYGAVRRTG
jgi:deoxyribodipyrimidine photo-lyase